MLSVYCLNPSFFAEQLPEENLCEMELSSGRAALLYIQFLVGKYLSIPFTKKNN